MRRHGFIPNSLIDCGTLRDAWTTVTTKDGAMLNVRVGMHDLLVAQCWSGCVTWSPPAG